MPVSRQVPVINWNKAHSGLSKDEVIEVYPWHKTRLLTF